MMMKISLVFSFSTFITTIFVFLLSGTILLIPAEGAGGSYKKASQAIKKFNQFKAKKGDIYRQEFAAEEAEDMAKILGLSKTITVSGTTYENCIKTKDYSPLEPDVVEHKYYAPNVGVVYEEVVKGGKETVGLVEVKTK